MYALDGSYASEAVNRVAFQGNCKCEKCTMHGQHPSAMRGQRGRGDHMHQKPCAKLSLTRPTRTFMETSIHRCEEIAQQVFAAKYYEPIELLCTVLLDARVGVGCAMQCI